MNNADKKRLLRAWLSPKNKRRIYSHAVHYSRVFRATPDDLVQWTWVILSQRPSFGPGENVIWRAQDAMQNLAANRVRTKDYKLTSFFSHAPIGDEEEGEIYDERQVVGTIPHPEAILIERENVELCRAFIAELMETLSPIERGLVSEGMEENYDTTELQQKLKATRDQISKARVTLKEKAEKLAGRWTNANRPLPAFLERLMKKGKKS